MSDVQVTEILVYLVPLVLFVTTLMSLEMMGYVMTLARELSTRMTVAFDTSALVHVRLV